MYKVFADTNVLLDLSSAARPEHESAKDFLLACAETGAEPCALASSYKDVYFVFGRHYGSEGEARELVKKLRRVFTTVDLTDGIVEKALFESAEPDLEDAMIAVAAEDIAADILVSRDIRAFSSSRVPKMAPAEAAIFLRDGQGAR